jgi:hypothetical protein
MTWCNVQTSHEYDSTFLYLGRHYLHPVHKCQPNVSKDSMSDHFTAWTEHQAHIIGYPVRKSYLKSCIIVGCKGGVLRLACACRCLQPEYSGISKHLWFVTTTPGPGTSKSRTFSFSSCHTLTWPANEYFQDTGYLSSNAIILLIITWSIKSSRPSKNSVSSLNEYEVLKLQRQQPYSIPFVCQLACDACGAAYCSS